MDDDFMAADQSQPCVMCIDSFQLIDFNIVGQYRIQPTVWLTVITHRVLHCDELFPSLWMNWFPL